MSEPSEFFRPVRLDTLGAGARSLHIEADAAERAALARRFGLIAIERLVADADLTRESDSVLVEGRLSARATQSCVATGDPVEARVDEPFRLRFVPDGGGGDPEEIELDEADLDMIGYAGGAIDLGEAVAQGFALALPPFPRVADAEARLRAAGVRSEEEAEADRRAASPFAALKGLTKDR